MKAIVVIPARYSSSRFPGKPLVKLLGKPMIQWVAELSSRAVGMDNVYIATDDNKIKNTVTQLGYRVVMTSSSCLTGTDRLGEVAKKVDADIYVNVQGDEPLLDPEDIRRVIIEKTNYPSDVINCYTEITESENPYSRNIPKVIFTENNRLIYVSRQVIPGIKDESKSTPTFYKQVCIYGFSQDELLTFCNFGRKSILEQSEDIEILRFFELNKQIRLLKTDSASFAVDSPEDIPVVESHLRKAKIFNY